MDFSKNLKNLRLSVKMSQKELANKLGICQSNISDWENDVSRPEYERLIEIADIFDVSLDELLGRKEI